MLKSWFLALRPKTLMASIAPVCMGGALATWDDAFFLPAFLVALLAALLIQIGTNFANDYYDFIKGADTEDRLGPTRATQAGLIKPHVMRTAFIFSFALAFLSGLYLVYHAGLAILVVGVLSIAFGVLYTGGPFPLAYSGLGDIFVFIFFGPVAVGGTYYVQALSITPEVAAIGCVPGFLSVGILAVNNLRDWRTDTLANKRTLAVRFGASFVRWEYVFCMVMGCCLPVLWGLQGVLPLGVGLTFLGLIPGTRLIYKVFHEEGAALNEVLANTGKVLGIVTTLFAIGLLFF